MTTIINKCVPRIAAYSLIISILNSLFIYNLISLWFTEPHKKKTAYSDLFIVLEKIKIHSYNQALKSK